MHAPQSRITLQRFSIHHLIPVPISVMSSPESLHDSSIKLFWVILMRTSPQYIEDFKRLLGKL